jgi:predicted lipid carrier protein YhbT
VVRYLSEEWFDEATRLLAEPGGPDHPADQLVVQQVVEQEAITEPVTWHVVVGDGVARLARGRHPNPDVTLTCDLTTAWEVHQGRLSAQAAFMAGRLRLGGDASALLAGRDALAAVDDRLAPLRAATEPA